MTHKLRPISLTIIGIFCALFFVSLNPLARAQSPTLSPTTDPDIQEKVEDRLQKVLNEKTDKKRAFAGEIRHISGTIEISTKSDTKLLLPSETDLTVIGSNKENLEIGQLEIGLFIIGMGYLTEEGTLDTRRIVVTQKPAENTRRVVFGRITDITNDGENILTVTAGPAEQETIYEVETNTKTAITSENAEALETLKFADLKVDNRVVVVGSANAKNPRLITATTIYIVPAVSPVSGEIGEESPAPTINPLATPTTKKSSPLPTSSE